MTQTRDTFAVVNEQARHQRNGHAPGLTADELAWRIGVELWLVRRVLNEEQSRRRVRLDPATGVYSLTVDAFAPEVVEVLSELVLV